jgi:DNA-binding XRE family transcriptional regulator
VTMAKNFKELQEKMPREVRLRSKALAEKMISEMGLAELRAAMDMTQESLANALHVKQASISKMERRSDMYISTLSKIIEAMGGVLQIVAKMPNGNVKIRQFTQIRQDKSETASPSVNSQNGWLAYLGMGFMYSRMMWKSPLCQSLSSAPTANISQA